MALWSAWKCLDYEDEGFITKPRFEALMTKLKPHFTAFEVGVVFKFMDPDNSGMSA